MKEQKTAEQVLRETYHEYGIEYKPSHILADSVAPIAMQSYSDQQNAKLRDKLASEIESREHWQRQTQRYQKYHRELNAALERVKELEGEVNRTIDNLHMEIHVMITDARIAVTKLGIDHDKSEEVDRLLYDLDVLQGKMMDAFKTKETK